MSNIYDPAYLAWIFETSRIKPTIIQNRFYAEGLDYCLPILELCATYGAKFQSFWTLTANPHLVDSPAVHSLAAVQSLSCEAALYKFLMTTSRFGTPGLIVPLNGTTDVSRPVPAPPNPLKDSPIIMSALFNSSRVAVRAASAAPSAARAFSSTPAPQATLRELEQRIKSVGNIGKITKSMKMVAASRLARAQKAMTEAKAYGAANNAVFEQSEASKSEAKVEKILYIVASSDRGLCGGIHSSVAKAAKRDIESGEGQGKEIRVVALGEKPKQQMARGDGTKDLELSFSQIGKSVPTFGDALAIADKIEAVKYDFDKVKIIYNKFLTVISYEASVIEIYSQKALQASPAFAAYEVEGDELAGDLASFAMANAIYAGLVEGYAAEISARRNAMENASKNAEEMISKLQMQFNRMRQAAITNELVDIITGASAL
ncbi:hypothetical protein JCM5296_003943 [Sporobolomyces johnsonii]